jgi:hypothetical protein
LPCPDKTSGRLQIKESTGEDEAKAVRANRDAIVREALRNHMFSQIALPYTAQSRVIRLDDHHGEHQSIRKTKLPDLSSQIYVWL